MKYTRGWPYKLINSRIFPCFIILYTFLIFVNEGFFSKDIVMGGYLNSVHNMFIMQPYFLLRTVDWVFFILWVALITSIFISWLKNPLYKILNLILLSIVIVLMWSYYLDFTFILLCYIIAFTSAVVMLFLSVVLMLPLSYDKHLNLVIVFTFLDELEFFQNFNQEGHYGVSAVLQLTIINMILIIFTYPHPIELKVFTKGKKSIYKLLLRKHNFVISLSALNHLYISDCSSNLLNIIQKYKNENLLYSTGIVLSDLNKISFAEFNSSAKKSAYVFFIIEDDYKLFLRSLGSVSKKWLWADVPVYLKFFFTEFCLFFYSLLDNYFLENIKKNHLSILRSFEKKLLVIKNPFLKYCLHYFLKLYTFLHTEWEQKKKSYPGKHSKWEVPMLAVRGSNLVCIRIFDWWNPFYIGSRVLKTFYFFKNLKYFDFDFIKYNFKFYFEWLVQCLIIFVIYSFFVPFGLVFVKEGKFIDFYEVDDLELDKENFNVVDVETLVGVKQYLYENMPLFILVSVNILLVALISASLLKKK